MKKIIILSFMMTPFFLSADPVSVNPRPRMQSMGNAGLATVGDYDSAMVNPAGLADVEKSRVDALPLLIEVPFDIDLITAFTDFNDVRESNAGTAEKRAA
ncbi:MAG: hypothetical protein J0L93_08445, partial [Deltaproteobacteria bacterium]|nr:hypothetical protein [Deltaproteobacteria bacterium]